MALDAVRMRVMKILRYVKSVGLIEMKFIVAISRVLLSRKLTEVLG
jgi:hypothetical protein